MLHEIGHEGSIYPCSHYHRGVAFSELAHQLLKHTMTTTNRLNINTRDAYFTYAPYGIYSGEGVNLREALKSVLKTTDQLV